jgi:four helix bundle protein
VKTRSYKDLIVYQKSYALCLEIYRITGEFPRAELYGLTSQMRRAAVSIPSNIAEGYRRRNRKEYMHFLRIAHGSCAELETQLALSTDLGFMPETHGQEALAALDEVSRMLRKMHQTLESKQT